MADVVVPAAPSSAGRDSNINIPAIVGAAVAAVVVLVVAVLLTTRRRRGHTFQRDAWGLPVNPVVRSPHPPTLSALHPNLARLLGPRRTDPHQPYLHMH